MVIAVRAVPRAGNPRPGSPPLPSERKGRSQRGDLDQRLYFILNRYVSCSHEIVSGAP